MNVLIYDGPGVTSLQKTLIKSLKSLLSTRYDVIPVDDQVLCKSPWEASTQLVVMPGGKDLQFLNALEPEGICKIKEYVNQGGKYLGLCAGAYFACSKLEFELNRPFYEVSGSRPLGFCPGIAIGSVTPRFEYGSEVNAQALSINNDDNVSLNVYVNGTRELIIKVAHISSLNPTPR